MDPETIKLVEVIVNSIVHGIVNILGMWFLVYYSIHRKFKLEGRNGFWGRLDRWRVEIIIAGVLIPQWADWLPKMFE